MRTAQPVYSRRCSLQIVILAAALLLSAAARAATMLRPDPKDIAAAIGHHRVVLLGEVHDNGAQHALRLAVLDQLLATGARPAIAFEQFDRERQAEIDAARRERPHDAGYLIQRAQPAAGWDWSFYRPYVQLALDNGLPIVAANLSRADAMQVANQNTAARPEGLSEAAFEAHKQAIADGHCQTLPAEVLPAMAAAQVARDRALAAAIEPYANRGVVLLTGNGHARIDIGVPLWLPPKLRASTLSIAFLERDGSDTADPDRRFDAYVLTEAAARPDPCQGLRNRGAPTK